MRLVHNSADIDLVLENKITSLYVEDKTYFRKLVVELISQINGGTGEWVLSNKTESISLKSNVLLLHEYYNFDSMSKILNRKLQDVLIQRANEELDLLASINSRLQELFQALNINMPIDISFQEYITAQDLVKLGGFHFSFDSYDIPSSLLGFLECAYDLVKPCLIILIDLERILDSREIQDFYNACLGKNISILVINAGNREGMFDKNLETTYTIDKDWCLI